MVLPFHLFCSVHLYAQVRQSEYCVDSAIVSYKVSKGNSQTISRGDILFLTDSIKVASEGGFDGCLSLHSPDGTVYSVYSPKGPCSLKDAVFSKALTKIKQCIAGFRKGLLDPVIISRAALRHHWGDSNTVSDGLFVQFECKGQIYSSFASIPYEEPCKILMTNKTDSVMVYSLVFQYKTKESNSLRNVVVDQMPDEAAIILVPGESVILPLPFIRPRGYLVYYLNVYGGTDFFVLNIGSDTSISAEIYAENEQLNTYRYYYESYE